MQCQPVARPKEMATRRHSRHSTHVNIDQVSNDGSTRDEQGGRTAIGNRSSALSITLTQAQAEQLLRDASVRRSQAALAAGLGPATDLKATVGRLMADERYSRSLARAMLVYASIPSSGEACTVTALAQATDMAPSIVHRYLGTFVELGLLERDPASRAYRRPMPSEQDAH